MPAWLIYQRPEDGFDLQYPSDWFIQDGAESQVRPTGQLTTILSSFPLGSSEKLPATGAKVDVIVYPVALGDCRAAPDGANATSLGGFDAWRRETPKTSVGDVRSIMVASYRDGSCFMITGYFGEEAESEVFEQILASFRFDRAEE
jgi:hypothetical protein